MSLDDPFAGRDRHDGRLWHPAVVVTGPDDRPALEIEPLSACQRCRTGHGCGAGTFSRLFVRRRLSLALPDEARFETGTVVQVGISERAVIKAAGLGYGLPVLVFVAAVVIGQGLAGQGTAADGIALLSGLACAGAVYALLRRRPGLGELDIRIVESGARPGRCGLESIDR